MKSLLGSDLSSKNASNFKPEYSEDVETNKLSSDCNLNAKFDRRDPDDVKYLFTGENSETDLIEGMGGGFFDEPEIRERYIENAISNSEPYDTIDLYGGTYTLDTLRLTHPLHIKGNNNTKLVITEKIIVKNLAISKENQDKKFQEDLL